MNFVILADKRTGSTFLQEALNSHPDIKVYDEMFIIRGAQKTGKRRGQFLFRTMKSKRKMNIKDYLDWLYNTEPDKSVGFRLMYPQDDHWHVLDVIKKSKIPIIHLKRNNFLKMIISKKTRGEFKTKPQKFAPNSIISDIKNHQNKRIKFETKILKYKNQLTVDYESMIGKTEGEKGEIKKFGAFNLKSDMKTYVSDKMAKKICNFLGVENKPLFCNVTKKNSNNVWDYISNKEEIEKILKRKGYGEFIK